MDNLSILNFKEKPILVLFSSLVLSSVLFYISILSGFELLFLGLSFAVLYAYFIITNPKYWIYSIVMISPLYLFSNETEVDLSDYLSAALWIGGLFIWLFHSVLFRRRKLVEDISDWLFLFFYLCIIINFFVAYLNGNDLEIWIRTVARFSIPLLYFPIKEHIKTKDDLKNLLILLMIAIFILSFLMLYETSLRLQHIKQAWEVSSILRLNQSIYGVSVAILISAIIYAKELKNKLILIIFLIPILTVFISSLSRIFWFGLFVALIYAVFFLPKQQRKVIFISFISLIVVSIIIGYALLGDKAELFLLVFEKRLTSIANFMEDASFLVRFQEYAVAFEDIVRSPFIGNGFAHKIMYYSKLTSDTWHVSNVHNGYILITLRFGIPLAIIYYSVYFYKFVKTINILSRAKYSFEKMILLGVSAGFIVLFISNLLSAAVMSRDADFLIAIMFALISITTRLIKNDVSR